MLKGLSSQNLNFLEREKLNLSLLVILSFCLSQLKRVTTVMLILFQLKAEWLKCQLSNQLSPVSI